MSEGHGGGIVTPKSEMRALVRGPRPGGGAAPTFGERPCTVSRRKGGGLVDRAGRGLVGTRAIRHFESSIRTPLLSPGGEAPRSETSGVGPTAEPEASTQLEPSTLGSRRHRKLRTH